jgi:hypothetical protein
LIEGWLKDDLTAEGRAATQVTGAQVYEDRLPRLTVDLVAKKRADAQLGMNHQACAPALPTICFCFGLLNYRPATAQQVEYQHHRSDDE